MPNLMGVGLGIVLLVVVVGVAASVGAQITQTLDDQTAAGTASNAIGNATQGLGNFASLFPVLGLVGIAALVITLLVVGLGGAGRA